MRSYGYWHYHPADTLTHEFPMDDSRVLQLATPPEGLVLTTLPEYQVLRHAPTTVSHRAGWSRQLQLRLGLLLQLAGWLGLG